MSVIDLHPDLSAASLRGSLGTSEGAASNTTKESADFDSLTEPTEEKAPAGLKTRSGRVSKPAEHVNISAFSIYTYLDEDGEKEPTVQELFQAMAASANPDILYFHEAMKAPDKEKFIKAMEEEVRTHSEGKHWIVVPRSSVPND